MMDNNNSQAHLFDLSKPLQMQLKMTARVALGISVLAAIVLLLTLYFLFKGHQQGSYLAVLQSFAQSQDELVPAMLLGGAMIILIAGVVTWFILLFSSARIAGPLFRFSRNVEMQISEGPVETIKLRKADYLQELSDKLSQAVDGLAENYAQQVEVIDELSNSLDSKQPLSMDEYNKFLQQLKDRVNR